MIARKKTRDYHQLTLTEKDKHAGIAYSMMEAFRKRDLKKFQSLLDTAKPTDINYKFGEERETLLFMAAKSDDNARYVQLLLGAGADPNAANFQGQAPIHTAAYNSNNFNLEFLLEHESTNVNILDDHGCTALHYTAEPSWKIRNPRKHLACVSMLMTCDAFLVNRPDYSGFTPFATAAFLYYDERVRVMIEDGGDRLNIDCSRGIGGVSIRTLIKRRYPTLEKLLPPVRRENLLDDDPYLRTLAALQRNRYDLFEKAMDEIQPNYWYDDPYYASLIEIACQIPDRKYFVRLLLERGADPNTVNRIYGLPVLHQTAELANYKTMKELLKHRETRWDTRDGMSNTVLHALASRKFNTDEQDVLVKKCFILIMRQFNQNRIDWDSRNINGTTPLLFAAANGNDNLVLYLLRHGADCLARNRFGNPPLSYIDHSVLKAFLDEQLKSNGLAPQSEDYQIIIKYDFMPNTRFFSTERNWMSSNRHTESSFTMFVAESEELRPLLSHPVIAIFLYMKWHDLQAPFYIVTLFHIFLVLLTTWYVLMTSSCNPKVVKECNRSVLTRGIEIVLAVMLSVAVLKEVIRMVTNCRRFFTRFVSYLGVAMIASLSLILTLPKESPLRHHVNAVTMLVMWSHLLLFTGGFPSVSEKLAMLQRVTANIFKFLSWAWLIFIAFGISFIILLRKVPVDPNANAEWDEPIALFKIILMMCGEFNLMNIHVPEGNIICHLFYILFIIFVSTCLYQLICGLAITDIQSIRRNTELLAQVHLVRVISGLEQFITQSYILLRPILSRERYRTSVSNRVSLFGQHLQKKQIHIFPRTGEVKFLLDAYKTTLYRNYRVNKRVLHSAMRILKGMENTADK